VRKQDSKPRKEARRLWLQHGVTVIALEVKMKVKRLQTFCLWLNKTLEKNEEFEEVTLEYLLTFTNGDLARGLLKCVKHEQEQINATKPIERN